MQRIVFLLLIVCLHVTHSLAAEPVKFKVMFVNSNKIKVAGNIICKGDTINDSDVIQWSNNKQVVKVMNLQKKNVKYVLSAVDARHVSGNQVWGYIKYLKQRQSGFQFQRRINTFERGHLSHPDINFESIIYHAVTLLDSLEIAFPPNEIKSEMKRNCDSNCRVHLIEYALIIDSCNVVLPWFDQFSYTSSPEIMPNDAISGYLHFERDRSKYIFETGKIIVTRDIFKTRTPCEGLLKIYVYYGKDCYEQQFRIRPVDYDEEENNGL